MTGCHYIEKESVWLMGETEFFRAKRGALGDCVGDDCSDSGDRSQGWVTGHRAGCRDGGLR